MLWENVYKYLISWCDKQFIIELAYCFAVVLCNICKENLNEK